MSDDVSPNPGPLVHPARTAVILVVVAALLLLGLLLLERSGPSPVQHLRSISSGQPAAASATGSGGQSSTLARTAASPSRLANADPSGGGVSSQLTAIMGQASAMCRSFLAGTATTLPEVDYDTKGTTVSKVTVPGAFFYWVTVNAAGAGTESVTVTQSTTFAPMTGTPIFALVPSGSAAFDSSCNSVSPTITGDGSSATVSFTAPAAGTFAVAVEYMTHDIIGDSPASTTPGPDYTYTFSDGASGSTQAVTLNHV
jgi:hypothetical protein